MKTQRQQTRKRETVSKQEILAQIRRLAGANKGVPPGSQSFAKLTGIRESQWNGIHWARWSDAVVEAGYPPNKLNPRVPDHVRLAALCRIVRKLGHFPTQMEIRLCCKNDPELPGPWSILRMGKRSERIMRVIDYCGTRAELADARSICAKAAEGVPSQAFVYLFLSVGSHGTARHKIGHTIDVERRAREISAHSPDAMQIVHAIETDDPVGVEAYWHKRFQSKRIKGEWFQLTAADVAAFKKRICM